LSTRNHVSASQISDWLLCRLKWSLGHGDQPASKAQQVGILTHCALGAYHVAEPEDRSWSTMEVSLTSCAALDGMSTEVQLEAHNLVQRYYKLFGQDVDIVPTEIEHKLTVPDFIKDVDLVLIPDDVTRGDTIHFSEYKTTSKKPFPYNDVVFKHGIQTMVYKVGLELYYNKVVDYVDYTFMWPTGVERERRYLPPSDYWLSYLRGIVEEMFTASIYPTPGALCGWCQHEPICRESAVTGISPLDIVKTEEGWQ